MLMNDEAELNSVKEIISQCVRKYERNCVTNSISVNKRGEVKLYQEMEKYIKENPSPKFPEMQKLCFKFFRNKKAGGPFLNSDIPVSWRILKAADADWVTCTMESFLNEASPNFIEFYHASKDSEKLRLRTRLQVTPDPFKIWSRDQETILVELITRIADVLKESLDMRALCHYTFGLASGIHVKNLRSHWMSELRVDDDWMASFLKRYYHFLAPNMKKFCKKYNLVQGELESEVLLPEDEAKLWRHLTNFCLDMQAVYLKGTCEKFASKRGFIIPPKWFEKTLPIWSHCFLNKRNDGTLPTLCEALLMANDANFTLNKRRAKYRFEPLIVTPKLEPKQGNQPQNTFSYRCTLCDGLFKKMEQLIDHLKKQHASLKVYRCSECISQPYVTCSFEKFKEHYEIAKHPMNSLKASFPLLTCKHCAFDCETDDELKHHMRFAHSPNLPFTCSFCSFACATEDILQEHNRNNHNPMNERKRKICYYHCALCAKVEKSLSRLQRHIRQEHFLHTSIDERYFH